jgi:hypothetical protein
MLSFVVQIDARTSAAGSPVSVSYGGDVFSATVWGGGPLVPVTMTLHMHTQPCSSGLVGLAAFCLPVIATLEATAASGASSVQCVWGPCLANTPYLVLAVIVTLPESPLGAGVAVWQLRGWSLRHGLAT